MDLMDLIESHRFLGTEFLMWLWYKSDVFEGRFNIGERPCEVWFDDQIKLEAVMVETEQSVLKGASPTFTPEAREALRQGKLPTQAKLRIVYDEKEFQFTLKASELKLSGIKLPALMTRSDDEKFYERMYLMELIEELVEDLYGEFLGLRLHPAAWTSLLGAIHAWIKSDDLMDVVEYRKLRDQAPPLVRVRKATPIAAEAAPVVVEEAPAGMSAEAVVEAASEPTAEVLPPADAPPAETTAPF